jgi:hypothetical protein
MHPRTAHDVGPLIPLPHHPQSCPIHDDHSPHSRLMNRFHVQANDPRQLSNLSGFLTSLRLGVGRHNLDCLFYILTSWLSKRTLVFSELRNIRGLTFAYGTSFVALLKKEYQPKNPESTRWIRASATNLDSTSPASKTTTSRSLMFLRFCRRWPPLLLLLPGRVSQIGLHLVRLCWVVPGGDTIGVLLRRTDEVRRTWVVNTGLMERDQWWLLGNIAWNMGSRWEVRAHDSFSLSFDRTRDDIRTVTGQKSNQGPRGNWALQADWIVDR